MTSLSYLIPIHAAHVRDPLTGELLSAEGAYKPRNAFWLRRLRDGDVAESTPSDASRATTTEPKKHRPSEE